MTANHTIYELNEADIAIIRDSEKQPTAVVLNLYGIGGTNGFIFNLEQLRKLIADLQNAETQFTSG